MTLSVSDEDKKKFQAILDKIRVLEDTGRTIHANETLP